MHLPLPLIMMTHVMTPAQRGPAPTADEVSAPEVLCGHVHTPGLAPGPRGRLRTMAQSLAHSAGWRPSYSPAGVAARP